MRYNRATVRASRTFTTAGDDRSDIVTCFRCGIRWKDERYRWKPGAPCYDCRPPLRAAGVDIEQYHRPRRPSEQRRSA